MDLGPVDDGMWMIRFTSTARCVWALEGIATERHRGLFGFFLSLFITYPIHRIYIALYKHRPQTLKLGGVKVANKVVVKLEHLNVAIHPRVLIDRVDVVLGMESVGGEAPNVFRKACHDPSAWPLFSITTRTGLPM